MPFKFNTLLRAILAGGGGAIVPSMYLNLSNAVNATIEDAQGNGTITSVAGGVINVNVSPSRTTGVAPLYVNFDMHGTTSSASANPAHDLLFVTDFGDPGAGTWAQGVQSAGLTSKNIGYGPVTGHVYETPGTYTVSTTAVDGTNPPGAMGGVITVLDPEVVFNAPNGSTVCLSTSGNFTGAPAGALTYTVGSDMYSAINTYKASNRRILFCKADNWTCSAQIVLANLSNMTIDGYGPGGAARAFGSGTLVRLTPDSFSASVFLTGAGNYDLRICNIKVAGMPSHSFGAVNETMFGLLWYRNEFRGGYAGWNTNSNSTNSVIVPTSVAYYECVVDDLYGLPFYDMPGPFASYSAATNMFTATAHGYAIDAPVKLRNNNVGSAPTGLSGFMGTIYYISATNYTANSFMLKTAVSGGSDIDLTNDGSCFVSPLELHGGIGIYTALYQSGIMGCYIDSCNHGEQTVRIPVVDRGHISNNYIARPNQSKNILKVHSSIHEVFPIWSEKFVISGNVLSTRNGYSYDGVNTNSIGNIAITMGNGGNGHANGTGGEFVRNGIVENNFTQLCLGDVKADVYFAYANCPNLTIRNNIADFSVGDRVSPFAGAYPFNVLGMVSVGTSTTDTTIGVRIYNNTLYSNLSNAQFASFVNVWPATGVQTAPDTIDIKNNLFYNQWRTGSNRGAVYQDAGAGTNITNTTNTSDSTVSPVFVNTPPLTLADWKPTAAWAINSGTAVPVLRDFNNNSRIGGTYDLGAVLP